MDRLILKAKRQVLREENAKYPATMAIVQQEQWPTSVCDLRGATPHAVWRSSRYLAVLYREPRKAAYRLSICRAAIDDDGRFADGLSWDEIQTIKSQCGFGNVEAIEIYPRDRDVVNVANLRHIWLVGECAETWRGLSRDARQTVAAGCGASTNTARPFASDSSSLSSEIRVGETKGEG